MRDAESILDQLLSAGGDELTADAVRDLLGLADEETVRAYGLALVVGDPAGGIAVLDALEDRGRDLRSFADQVVEALRAALHLALAGHPAADPLAAHGVGSVAVAARRLAAIDPARPGPGGLRLALELALFDQVAVGGGAPPAALPVAATSAARPAAKAQPAAPAPPAARRPPARPRPQPCRPPRPAARGPARGPAGRRARHHRPDPGTRDRGRARRAAPPLARGRDPDQPPPSDEAAHRGMPSDRRRRDGRHPGLPGEPALPARRRRPAPRHSRGRRQPHPGPSRVGALRGHEPRARRRPPFRIPRAPTCSGPPATSGATTSWRSPRSADRRCAAARPRMFQTARDETISRASARAARRQRPR